MLAPLKKTWRQEECGSNPWGKGKGKETEALRYLGKMCEASAEKQNPLHTKIIIPPSHPLINTFYLRKVLLSLEKNADYFLSTNYVCKQNLVKLFSLSLYKEDVHYQSLSPPVPSRRMLADYNNSSARLFLHFI